MCIQSDMVKRPRCPVCDLALKSVYCRGERRRFVKCGWVCSKCWKLFELKELKKKTEEFMMGVEHAV